LNILAEYSTRLFRAPILCSLSISAELLGRLSQDILDIEKIESHTLKLNKEKFNFTKTIFSVVQDINSSLMRIDRRRKINVRLGNQAGVANDNDDVVIEADKTRIIQVISNILNNAIRFTKNDDEITISIEMKEKEVMISVKDTGPGIDSNTLPKLFSRCALTPSSKAESSGLGLFISKSVVESHGGKIWAENNAHGRGSTFSFSLPINDVNRDRLKY
jgi:signal transduction histidine kinase